MNLNLRPGECVQATISPRGEHLVYKSIDRMHIHRMKLSDQIMTYAVLGREQHGYKVYSDMDALQVDFEIVEVHRIKNYQDKL